MNYLKPIAIGTVAALGIGLATSCKHNAVKSTEIFETKESIAPDYNRYCTDTIQTFEDGSSKVVSDTIHEVYRPVVNENGKVVAYLPLHFKSLKDGHHYLQMYDRVVVSSNNIDSAMRALAKDTITIAKKVR